MLRRNLHIVLAAAAFGVLIWLTVSLREQFQISVTVPIVVDNIPDGFAVRTPVPTEVRVRLRAEGWKLATVVLGSTQRLVLSAPPPPGRRHVILLNELADRLTLRPGIQIVDALPDTLTIELDRSMQKRVPVELQCSLSFGPTFGLVGPITASPESVTVVGAESVLRSVAAWKTVPRRFADLQAPLDAVVPLSPPAPYLLTLSPAEVRIRADIEQFAEKTFSGIPVNARSVPGNSEVIFVPPRIEVVVRAGMQQLAALDPADIHADADYAVIAADTSGTIEPSVSAPQGVQILQKHPERLTYIIRKAP